MLVVWYVLKLSGQSNSSSSQGPSIGLILYIKTIGSSDTMNTLQQNSILNPDVAMRYLRLSHIKMSQ